MMSGIIWALLAGLMLGFYALPAKFTREFKEENTWGMFFLLALFVVPTITALTMMKGVGQIYSAPGVRAILPGMIFASILWGIGMMMWGKAIHHIGVSLGFSLFIGTVIMVGSLLPFFVDGLPPVQALLAILLGLLFILVGLIASGKAGILRDRDELLKRPGPPVAGRKSMGAGITIAVVGGLLATGFSYANAVGRPPLQLACRAQGNPAWITAVAIMVPIAISGFVAVACYYCWQLTVNRSWIVFKTRWFAPNLLLTFIMALLQFSASVLFAYAAFTLGKVGNTVGYAIFNTASVVTAMSSGLVTGEWKHASGKAKNLLFIGLACMVIGISVIAVGNKIASDKAAAAPTNVIVK